MAELDSIGPVLDVRGLKTVFHGDGRLVRAVDGVSFTIARGETLAIVGESGSGKSVTSLSLMGLVARPGGEVVGGEVWFKGRDLLRSNEREMRALRGNRMAMIFQEPMTSLNPVLSVGRQLCESLQLHMGLSKASARERATELLALVGVPSPRRKLDDFPHHLSGGMRQRVMIAMAISCNPELLIADEPTTALDVTIQAQILELIKRLQTELGTAVMFITHDLGVVAGIADRVVVMYAGRVVEEGSTEALFANPRMPYTMGLLRSLPRADEPRGHRLIPIRGLPPDVSSPIGGCAFAPRCDHAVPSRCGSEVPVLREVAPQHRIACHFEIDMSTPLAAAA